MVQDDYFVIVYKILEYLYSCMKSGEKVNIAMICWDSKAIDINKEYWEDIIRSIYAEGYIRGVSLGSIMGQEKPSIKFSGLTITEKGIMFLQENGKMKKAAQSVKTVMETVKMFV